MRVMMVLMIMLMRAIMLMRVMEWWWIGGVCGVRATCVGGAAALRGDGWCTAKLIGYRIAKVIGPSITLAITEVIAEFGRICYHFCYLIAVLK